MKRLQSILAVVSGKDRGLAAVNQAASLAQQNSAKVTLLDAIKPMSDFFAPGTDSLQMHEAAKAEKISHMSQLATPLRERGLSVGCQLIEGDLAEKTIQCVVQFGHELVLKSAEHPTGIAQRMFGTTGNRLMRKCPCPVWIIKVDPEPRLSRILVAVRPKPAGQDRHPMNVTMLELATSLANQNECDVDVVYVWPKIDDASDNEQREIASLQQLALEALVGPFRKRVRTLKTHLLQGDPSAVIVRLTQTLDVDLLVMGTVFRSNFILFTIGSTAERVLDEVQCSVLAVKPDAFLGKVFNRDAERSRLLAGWLNPEGGAV